MKREDLPVAEILLAWAEVCLADEETWEPWKTQSGGGDTPEKSKARATWARAQDVFCYFIYSRLGHDIECYIHSSSGWSEPVLCMVYPKVSLEDDRFDLDELIKTPEKITCFVLSTHDPLNLTFYEGEKK